MLLLVYIVCDDIGLCSGDPRLHTLIGALRTRTHPDKDDQSSSDTEMTIIKVFMLFLNKIYQANITFCLIFHGFDVILCL